MRRGFGLMVLSVALLAGCSSGPSLNGKWYGASSVSGIDVKIEMDFSGSNQMVQTNMMTAQGQTATTKNFCTYTVKDQNIEFTVTKIEIVDVPAAFRAQAEQTSKEKIGTKQKSTFKLAGDKLTMTNEGGTALELTRNKPA